jgi:hypothetical protein
LTGVHRHRHHGDLLTLILYFQNKKSRLKHKIQKEGNIIIIIIMMVMMMMMMMMMIQLTQVKVIIKK